MRGLILFCLLSIGGLAGADTWRQACGTMSGTSVDYCVYENGPNPRYTIWFLHGLGDSEKVFQDPASHKDRESYTALLAGLPPVRIVAVSFGYQWLLTHYPDRTAKPVTATVSYFTTQIMPFFEAQFQLPKPYVLMGQSMGGFNTASVCAVAPSLWSKCVLLNPMLPTCDPFGGFGMCNPLPGFIIKANFTEAQYAAAKPGMLLSKASALPQTFVTACKLDKYQLFDGAKEWFDQGASKGFRAEWVPVMTGCDHFHWPAAEVLNFLAK